MDSRPAANLIDRFAKLNDPRDDRAKRHNLMDVVVIAICAVHCGADSSVDVELFGKSKKDWLRRLLELPKLWSNSYLAAIERILSVSKGIG